MKEPKDTTLLIYDQGLFTSWAIKLAPYFKRVLLFVPWNSAFPTSNKYAIGENLDGVEKVRYFWDAVREEDIDVFCFPDAGDGDIQLHLRDGLGKPTWGSAKAEELELFRYEAKQVFKDIGLPTKPYVRVFGMDALREYLRDAEDKYVKVSLIRGDVESFRHDTYSLSEPLLDDLERKLGARKFDKEFLIEDPIGGVELGYDSICIDGRYPQESVLFGREQKDVGYIGAIRSYDKLPDSLKTVNEALSPLFEQYRYRGAFSSEVREEDGKAYLLDPCMRMPSPPNEVMQEIYSNWPEVIVAGAHGELIEPVSTAKYGVQAMIHSDWAKQNWQPVHIPEAIASQVKLRNATKAGGTWYVAPQEAAMSEIGAVVATGNTIIEAIKKLKEYADQVKGYSLDIKIQSLEQAVAEIEESGEFKDDEIPDADELAEALV